MSSYRSKRTSTRSFVANCTRSELAVGMVRALFALLRKAEAQSGGLSSRRCKVSGRYLLILGCDAGNAKRMVTSA
jgi:hypothetical protein